MTFIDSRYFNVQNEMTPLIKLQYVSWKVGWKLFFPYSLAMAFAAIIIIGIATKKTPSVLSIASQFIFFMQFTGCIWLLIDMLLMDELCLYNDKVVQSYKLRGKKTILLSNAIIVIWRRGLGQTAYIYEPGSCYNRFFGKIYFDFSVGPDKSVDHFMKAVEELGYEFKDDYCRLIGIKTNKDGGQNGG